ncbi:hypothetical protein WA026_001295 [Henosepilachna vigintioctopunctata]|uniref:Uncharacterized protein n=1 Tax=Henosepilachna vigintioctopunctata TaxID=420089 RepID=A0AAW1UPH5_9CUCU
MRNEMLIAENFNEYFVTSIDKLVDRIPSETDVENILRNVEKHDIFGRFSEIKMKELKITVKKFEQVNTGEYGISILQWIFHFLIEYPLEMPRLIVFDELTPSCGEFITSLVRFIEYSALEDYITVHQEFGARIIENTC